MLQLMVENCKFFLSYSHVAPLFGCSIWSFVVKFTQKKLWGYSPVKTA